MVWWWFGVNMAGLRNIRNTNAFKFILQVFILSQKHIMGVKKVVWDGLDVVWGGLVVLWGGLGWFGVFPRTAKYVNKINSDLPLVGPWKCITKTSIHIFAANARGFASSHSYAQILHFIPSVTSLKMHVLLKGYC